MTKRISSFWLFQMGGWLSYFIITCFIYITFSQHISRSYFLAGFIELLFGFILTTMLRLLIIRINVLQQSLRIQILFLLVSAMVFSLLLSFCNIETDKLIDGAAPKNYREPVLLLSWGGNFFIIIIWELLYFAYHYVAKSNKERLDKAKLQSMVKDLELKTIKAHINPHFIFNALNSIRFLVDENPVQARGAITELSKLLRSSMQAENVSTTTLDSELEIVRSYLQLEKIRFEDRLNISFEIDPDSLDAQVPPMMLQTLVENGIKHGISKQIEGGRIDIHSKIQENMLVLTIENTGQLIHSSFNSGFGLASTRNRLDLMYGALASFRIKATLRNTVLAEICIPFTEQNSST